ncbi:MAG: hypothetical protein WC480_01680 [Patescibacteria group bacterium]
MNQDYRKDYEKLFAHLESIEPPANLLDKIMRRISSKHSLAAIKWRLAIVSVAVISSIIALVPASKMVQTSLAESGFLQFFSLLFSDFQVVTAYWQSFTLSLLETLPIISLTVLLVVVLVFLESLKLLARNYKKLILRHN